jgi:hypothetical protein
MIAPMALLDMFGYVDRNGDGCASAERRAVDDRPPYLSDSRSAR